MSEEASKIVFKRKNRKPLRKRQQSSDESESSEEENVRKTLEEMKELQKLRERPNGVSVVGLALGKKTTVEEEITKDPFRINSGGLINMNALKSGKIKTNDDAYDTGIGTQFSAETNKRDEDEEMMKYIEEQLSRRKGTDSGDESKTKNETNVEQEPNKYFTPEEAALQAVPKHLKESSTQRSEEMLSNQMLSGIPEVDLGIDAKIRNIEATEEAKLRLLWEKHNKKDGPSQFVPTNMAVNFVQHNRFNIEDSGIPRKKREMDKRREPPSSNNSNKKSKTEKATDDYHYEKFKKQFRRY